MSEELRAAARKVIAEYDARSLWHVVDYEPLTEAMYALDRAASQGDEGLDVDRLAKALHASGCRAGSVCGGWRHRDKAEAIAREYAALDRESGR